MLIIHFRSDDFICNLLGVAIYIIGLAGMALTCVVYEKACEHYKRKNAFDVIELAKEITALSE